MAQRKRTPEDIFPTSEEDLFRSRDVPPTPQTRSSAYQLAFADSDFLTSKELRPVRLQLELLKPELALAERGIRTTVVLFGGSRIPAPGKRPKASTKEARQKLKEKARYYDEARKFAKLASRESKKRGGCEFVVVSGGGPGIMEAANRGASEVKAQSIGHNIVLPHEQAPNEYITPELCFQFHYFAIRKMHFLIRSRAIAFFPGGFGTLDELFETLTLIQTGKARRMPVLLFGEKFWRRIVNFEALAEEGTISPEDLDLFSFVETAKQGWQVIADFYEL